MKNWCWGFDHTMLKVDAWKDNHTGAVMPWISYKSLWFLHTISEFPSWTVAFGHYPLLHQILLLTPLKHSKHDSTFSYDEVLSPRQEVLKYLQMPAQDSLRTCNMFWVCWNTLIILFTVLPLDNWMRNFMELLAIRQTRQGGTGKTWLHTGLQESIKYTSSTWENS